jgi:hypothetical protein
MQTAVEILTTEYQAAGKTYEATTRGYWSTFAIKGRFVNAQGANPTHAFLVFDKGQTASAFSYSQNEQRDDGFGGKIPANYAATNLTTARQTIQQEDFALHKFRLSAGAMRVKIPVANHPAGLDAVVTDALNGKIPLVDPGSTCSPVQVFTPSNLRDLIAEAIRPTLSLTLRWMGKNLDPVGLGSHCPDLPSRSMLMSGGEPHASNAYILQEGFVWRRAGSNKDSELSVQIMTEESVVIPVNLVTFMGVGDRFMPEMMAVDFSLQGDGVGFSYPSAN